MTPRADRYFMINSSNNITDQDAPDGLSLALAKRIKRRVTARTHNFFAATAPGLEHLCLSEILSLPLGDAQVSVAPGGVEFKGKLHDCYMANLYLRCANRVLMRIADFRASSFSALEKRVSEIDWELYLPPRGGLRVSVTSHKSKLYHKGAVSQRVYDGVIKRTGAPLEDPSDPGSHLFIRIDSDQVTVSLDSSGELLHKRGVKPRAGKAPIRETLAAAVLKIAGYRPGELLVDPMCGSGTFSLEAAMMSRNIPAGWFREFAFMKWPAFSPGRWRHLRREAEPRFVPAASPCVFASDAREQSSKLLEEHLSAAGLSNTVNVTHLDFFDLTPKGISAFPGMTDKINADSGLLVLNPPYGRRLGSSREACTLFTDIFKKLRRDFKGWKVAVIAPKHIMPKRMATSFQQHPFFHGGLDLVLLTGRV